MEIEGLKFLEETSWIKIFDTWKKSEGVMKHWQDIATQQKGWESWEEWRSELVKNFDAQNRKWFRHEINNSFNSIPNFYVGPFSSWQGKFGNTGFEFHTFADLLDGGIVRYEKVKEIIEDFPEENEFIGICLPDKKIVLIEGHHRATAITLMSQTHPLTQFKKTLTIAITFFEAGEEKIFDEMLKKGSAKK